MDLFRSKPHNGPVHIEPPVATTLERILTATSYGCVSLFILCSIGALVWLVDRARYLWPRFVVRLVYNNNIPAASDIWWRHVATVGHKESFINRHN